MDFGLLPPEINSGRLYTGPGPAPLTAAATAWDGLAAELHSAAALYGSTIAGLTTGAWQGPASISMAAAAAPYTAWMRTTATQAEDAAARAKAAVAAYEVTFAAMVPPPVIAANRAQLAALLATNIFGQNTAAIAATDIQYAEMWAQDAAAMYGYATVAAAATRVTPFSSPPQTVSANAQTSQTASLAANAGTAAAGNTQSVLSQWASSVPTALQGLAAPTSSTVSAADLPGGLLAGLELPGTLSLESLASGSAEATDIGLGTTGMITATGAWVDAAQDNSELFDLAGDWHDQLKDRIGNLEVQIMGRFDQLGASGPPAAAGLGHAFEVGSLSVPPGWAMEAPAMRLAAALPPATAAAAPAAMAVAGSEGGLFAEMALAGMTGRALTGAIGSGGSGGTRERVRAGVSGAVGLGSGGSSTSANSGIADEIREFAEILTKLGELRDQGLLTNEEFIAQKERLLGQ